MLRIRLSPSSALALFAGCVAGLALLGACSRPAPAATADDARIDAAMAKVEAEQTRTDSAELRKRREAAARFAKSLEQPEAERGITAPPTDR